MTLSFYSLPILFTGVGVALSGILVVLKNPVDLLPRLFLGCSISVSIWSLGYAFVYSSDDAATALQYARFAYIGVVFIPTFFCHFVFEFLNLARRKAFLPILYTISIGFLFLSQTNYFMDNAYKYFWGYYPRAGTFYWTFIVFFYAGFGMCVWDLLKAFLAMRKSRNFGIKYNQVKYVLFALCVASLNLSDYFPNYGIEIYPFAYLAAAGWLTIMAYGIFRYRVLDINIIIRKTLVYSAAMAILGTVYLAFISLSTIFFGGLAGGSETLFASSLSAALIAFGFQPLRRRIQEAVDKKFFRHYVDREEKLYELSRDVAMHTTREMMSASLLQVINETLHPKTVSIYLRSHSDRGFIRADSFGTAEMAADMSENNALAAYFVDHPQPFVLDNYDDSGESRSTRRSIKESRSG